VIGGLAHELDGEVRLTFETEGVVCHIVMPVTRQAATSHE
jgi:hypothetical protein